MTDEELLQTYVNLAPFLAKVCGPSCEIVVHSTVDTDRSLKTACPVAKKATL